MVATLARVRWDTRDEARNDAPRRLYRPSRVKVDGRTVKLPALAKHLPTAVVFHDADGRVVVASGLRRRSSNRKTGPMVQTWILPSDVDPGTAVRTGADSKVCGDCPHRPVLAKASGAASCYVDVYKAPVSVWRAVQRHSMRAMPQDVAYALIGEAGYRGDALRWGAWGDPGYLPVEVLRDVSAMFRRRTGYTHRWRDDGAGLQAYLMASVDSAEEAEEAERAGWRTFRVLGKGDTRRARTVLCPASKEAGNRTTCADCGLCGGAEVKARNVEIVEH